MHIKSYLLHYNEGKKERLIEQLQNLSNCEIIPAKNHDVIVLVTDAEDEESDKKLHNNLLEMEGLKHLSLVSGFDGK